MRLCLIKIKRHEGDDLSHDLASRIISHSLPRRERFTLSRRASLGAIAGGLSLWASPLSAASDNEVFRGKTIDLIVGFPTGGSNDLYARTLATHLGRFIPGHPTLVLRNMPGAGSVSAAAYMAASAPRDGTALALVAPTLPLDERLGTSPARFATADFGWVGRVNSLVNVIFVRSSSLQSINDAFEHSARLSATGAGSAITIYPNALNYITGTKFDLVRGYAGSAEGMLAVNRGEVDGHCTGWDTLKTSHPDWLTSKSIRVLVQFAAKRHAELPDIPTALECARTPRQVELMRAIVNASDIGTSFFTTPHVPHERLTLLRHAFDQCMNDPHFQADLTTLRVGLSPLSGEAVAGLVRDVHHIADELVPDLQKAQMVLTAG